MHTMSTTPMFFFQYVKDKQDNTRDHRPVESSEVSNWRPALIITKIFLRPDSNSNLDFTESVFKTVIIQLRVIILCEYHLCMLRSSLKSTTDSILDSRSNSEYESRSCLPRLGCLPRNLAVRGDVLNLDPTPHKSVQNCVVAQEVT